MLRQYVEQVQGVHATVRPELHHLPLKDLDRKSVKLELARNWITESPNGAAVLEEIPERIVVDAKAGLCEQAVVGGLRVGARHSRHLKSEEERSSAQGA